MNYAWFRSSGETATKGTGRYASWGGGWEFSRHIHLQQSYVFQGWRKYEVDNPLPLPHDCTRLDLVFERFNSLKWEKWHFGLVFVPRYKQIRKNSNTGVALKMASLICSLHLGTFHPWLSVQLARRRHRTRRWKSIKWLKGWGKCQPWSRPSLVLLPPNVLHLVTGGLRAPGNPSVEECRNVSNRLYICGRGLQPISLDLELQETLKTNV